MIFWTVDTRELDALCRAFSPESRTRLHHAAARSVSVLCRRHLRTIGQSRHATANRLGAAPTGHFEQTGITLTAAPNDAHVRLTLPGLARAFRPLVIRPRRAKALTLPIAAEAYGKKVSELKRSGWALFQAKGVLMGKSPAGSLRPLYALKTSVRLRQDRTLLPADERLAETARKGYLRRLAAFLRT